MKAANRYPLRGRVALVTGAARGIGARTSEELRRRGASVVCVDVAYDTAVTARGQGQSVLCINADVTAPGSMDAAVATTLDAFGKLDLVIANAGIAPPTSTLRRIDRAAFDRVIAVNQTGAWNTVRAALEPIIDAQGQIQLICSGAAFSPSVGGAAYMISKAALEQLGRALRIETAPYGVTVCTVYLGIVDTEMTRTTLDEDPFGHRIGELLPSLFSRRVSSTKVARSIVDAAERRSTRVVLPPIWGAYSMLRGLVNPIIDRHLMRNKQIDGLVRALDQTPT